MVRIKIQLPVNSRRTSEVEILTFGLQGDFHVSDNDGNRMKRISILYGNTAMRLLYAQPTYLLVPAINEQESDSLYCYSLVPSSTTNSTSLSKVNLHAELLSASNYYAFGMLMPGRGYQPEDYRFGFNGKEHDDEIKGAGNSIDYGMRVYDGRIGKFLSVDPLMRKYPMLTPYQFASNRSIDGIDLDGLEYYSVHIRENADGSRTKLFVVNYNNIKNAGDVNVETANGVGPRGDVGVTYVIHKFDKDGKETGMNSFNVKNSEHGVYAGPNNPKEFWNKLDKDGNYPDDYSLSPIDETDANAMQHDKDFDNIPPNGIDGLSGTLDSRSSAANNAFIERADKTTEKYVKKENDIITGKPVTKATSDAGQKAARTGGLGFRSFRYAEYLKNVKIEKPKGP